MSKNAFSKLNSLFGSKIHGNKDEIGENKFLSTIAKLIRIKKKKEGRD